MKKLPKDSPASLPTVNKKRLKNLREAIHKHDHYYYNLDQPEISDYEYDQLFTELAQLEKQHPTLITPDSPTQRVPGKALSHFEKGYHKTAMLSLQNTYNEEEIISFYDKTLNFLQKESVDFLLEPKLDGVAISLLYENGYLTQALTRGDGNTGENVFENIKTIRSIPLHLSIAPELLEIRGEVVLLKTDFEKINQQQTSKGLSHFANPRNMAAGSLRQLDPSVTALRPLRFFAHSPGIFKGIKLKSQRAFLQTIKKAGLPVLPIVSFKYFQSQNKNKAFSACALCKNKNEVLKYFYTIEKIRHHFPYETDGIVIKVNPFFYQKKLGAISRSPRWARAAKFEPERGETCIQNISLQIGRTGVLTPVAHLEPVSVGGVTITHATLHNLSEILKKDIRVGDRVIVGRAGDVIPEVIKVNFSKRKKDSSVFKMPKKCPSCLLKVQTIRDIVFCINPLCPAVVLQSLIHFTSKKAMNIESLGSKIMERLYNEGLVKTFSDIYKLTKEKLLKLEGMGEKSSQRILSNIEKSKKTKLPAFVFALGIRHVGEQTAHNISQFFIRKAAANQTGEPISVENSGGQGSSTNSMAALHLIAQATEEELQKIPDIGEVAAQSIRNSFSRKAFKKELSLLLNSGIQIHTPKKTNSVQVFLGKRIAITGSLPQNRAEVEKKIFSLGGTVQNSVNKTTDFLLQGSKTETPSQKEKKAKKLNTPILDWNTFQKKIKSSTERDGKGRT